MLLSTKRTLLLGRKPAYLGPVTNGRTRAPTQITASNKQIMSRSYHYATDNISAVQLVFLNGYFGSSGVLGTGGTAQISASILSADVSTRIQVLFGGAAVKTAADKALVFSDIMPVFAIPNRSKFFVDNWFNGAAAATYVNEGDTTNGDMCTYGASVADTTMSNWTGTGGAGVSHRPVAILGYTSKGTVYIAGDSRSVGITNNSTAHMEGARIGELLPSMPNVGVINMGVYGLRLADIAADTLLRTLISYCTNVIIQAGVNSLNTGLAQMQADTLTIKNFDPSKKVWLTTKAPVSTSSDSWTTQAGQTVGADNATGQSYNAWARGIPLGYAGCLDIASVLENGTTGKWKTDEVTANLYTNDGVHSQPYSYGLIPSAAVIDENLFLSR